MNKMLPKRVDGKGLTPREAHLQECRKNYATIRSWVKPRHWKKAIDGVKHGPRSPIQRVKHELRTIQICHNNRC